MYFCCFICNYGLPIRSATYIFGENSKLQSGNKLSEVVGQIVDKTLNEQNVHAKVLCKKCYKLCTEYDLIHNRLQKLKNEILDQFKQSVAKNNLDYDNYEKTVAEKYKPSPKQPVILGKKLVLPASKLQPIPPDLLLKVGKIPLSKNSMILPQIKASTASTLNLKVTVGTSVLTQTIKTTTSKLDKQTPTTSTTTDSDILSTLTNSLKKDIESMSTSSNKTSVINFNMNSLPKNFLSEAVMSKMGDDGKSEDDEDDDDDDDDDDDKGNDDDNSMEIDEDCPMTLVPAAPSNKSNMVLEVDKSDSKTTSEVSEFLNVEGLSRLDTSGDEPKFILGKLEILNEEEGEDDEEGHTIVLDGENGSILRMVSGQKFIYEGGEISLVMADDEQLQDSNDLNDEQNDDSNDETAIELQMAGDEETAKAILAATQEQGGAFIKVESGEMFRVQSVDRRDDSLSSIVAKEGSGFRCLLCETNTVCDAESTMRHMKVSHDARIYICQFCSAIMRKRNEYAAHIAEHASKLKTGVTRSNHLCTTCGKTFGSRALLLQHSNVHAGLRPYQCHLCTKTFASKYTHQAHLKTHAIRPRPFKCDQCGKSFLTHQNLLQHEKTHTGIKDFICNICNKAFSTQHNLEVHGVVHSGNKAFACDMCGKAFARRAELRDHMRTHTGEKPFACDICDARFTQRSNLHSHRRATHLDDRRYHCTECPKRFKRRRLLEYHMKASHTGERPLKCKVCAATFVYPEHYKKHIRIHSGERPYVCEICGKSFNSRDNRNTHRFVHSDKKPYECVACGAGYMRKQLLYAHMNTSGHLAESIVVNQPRVIKVTENGTTTPVDNDNSESQSSSRFDSLFETGELDASVKSVVKAESLDEAKLICNIITDDKKLILQDDKTTFNLIQESEDPTLLTIHNLSERTQNAILEAVSSEQLGEQTEIVANDENGGVVRLIQIKLPDGNDGWVALDR